MIHQYVREKFGPDTPVPSYPVLCRVWREWFGPGGGPAGYARSADLPEKNGHVLVHRPGQVVALDTTVLPVMVREGVFGDPVRCHLTLALDVYTHSLCAFRLTLVSDTSVDIAMLLRDVMMPLPMRPDWGEDLEWPYPGIPAAVVAEFAGHKVAGLPFFTPETVTTDHGSVYRNHALVESQRVLGCNILPARVLRPTDKAACERAFGVIRQLLFEHLTGYAGVDIADRGADPEGGRDADDGRDGAPDRHLDRRGLATAPAGQSTPRPGIPTAPTARTRCSRRRSRRPGSRWRSRRPDLFYELLPVHYVTRITRRGVKIRGLWYDAPVLDGYRGTVSSRGGRHKGQWVIRRDPRDRRSVFFQDPVTHAWHELPWTGMPPAGQAPAFGDARVRDLLRKADACGLRPKSDAELLPVLLEMIGARIPVSQWPTQMAKAERTGHAREAARAQAAQSDRPAGIPQGGRRRATGRAGRP